MIVQFMIFDSIEEDDYFVVAAYEIKKNRSLKHLGYYRGTILEITAQIEKKYKEFVYVERSKYWGWY